ncbi:MAG TPA: hypothetical protein VGL95_00245, partial [Acetobacteraceae bacterium]
VLWAIARALLIAQAYLAVRSWPPPHSLRESLDRCEAVHCLDNWPRSHMGPLVFNVPDNIDRDCGIAPNAQKIEKNRKSCALPIQTIR